MAEPTSSIHDPERALIVQPEEVRDRTGLNETDAPDGALQKLIRDAQVEAIGDIAKWVQGARLHGALDGVNRVFEVRDVEGWTLVWDQSLDKVVTGADVRVYALDRSVSPPAITEHVVESVNARHGRLTLETAPSAGLGELRLDAYVVRKKVEWSQLVAAVALLASYYADKRARQPGKIALSHPNIQREGARGLRPNRNYLDDYNRLIRKLRGPKGASAGIRTRLGERDYRGVL